MSSDNVHPGISLDGPYPERSNTILNTLIDSIANKEFGSTDSVNDAFESTRLVLSILETRFTLSNKQVTFLSNEFLALLHRPSLFHIPLQTQILHCLSIIWRRYRYCPTLGPVDWRFFLTLLQKIHIQLDYKRSAFGHNVVRGHRESLIKAIARGKRFFAPDSAPKIIEALWSRGGSPHNLSYHINFVLLHLFLPPDNYRTWVPMLMEKIQRIDPCSKVLACVLSVLSRSAKKDYNQRTFNFEQYLPQCFNWFLQHLPLSVDGATGVGDSRSSQKVWPKELDWILRSNALSRYTAKFIVYNIRKDSQQGISLLQRFFQATSTFFHPSNAGAWTSPLADFLTFVSRYFAKLYWKLPSDERTEIALNFFDAIFPIASSAIYSRSSTMVLCAQDCIKNLGYILPDKLFSDLVAEAKLNLETTSESNRTLASLSLLSAVCHPLFDRRIHPNGAQYLNTILWSALESFDGINLIKSISALSLFGMVFYMVPLLDGKEQMTDSDNEEEARHATVGFPEWALAFTEKLCNILKHFDAVEKTSHRDQGLARILYRTCRPFFCSLSRSSHHACLKFLTSFLLDNTQLKSRKYFGIITRVASLGYPERAFNDLTLPLLHQITSSGNDAGKIRKNLEELASEHVEWLLYLAATSIRESGGNHLVQYADQIASVFFAAVSSESKSVRKVGRKLMRYTLAALTTTYPVEFRPSSPTSWESSTWRHWQFWGEFAESFKSDPSQHKIVSWHRPSQSELLAGQKLTLAVISASQSVLLQNLPTSSIEEIINNLMNVRCVLEGCLTIAGDFSGEPISGHRSQNLFEPLRLLEPHYLKIGNASLRDWCTSVVLRVSSYFRETDNKSPSVKPELWTVLVSICNKLLNVTAISDDALEQTATSNRYAIRSQREFESGKRCIMRALLVEQSHIRYLRCFQLCRLFLSYTVDVRELINFVRWCCLLDFQSVRSLSTATLAQACDSRHFTRNEVVMSLTDIIRSHDVSDKVVLGAIECLHNRHFLSWITSSLDLVSSTIVSICDSSHHQDDLVQTALIEFFSAFADRLHLLPIHSADQIQAYNSLCTQLLHLSGNEEGKSSHWRSQLMAARFLLFALRNDINVSVQHLNFFWKHCFSDFVPLRRICISALSEVFTSFNSNSGELVMFSEIVTDSPSPAMLCELDSKVFYDTNDSGWSPDSKCAAFKATDFTKTTPLFPDWVISIQKSLGSDQMTKFVTALEEDHSKASQNAGSSKGRLGAGDVIAASVHELMQSRLCWPKTTFLSVHDALMFEHVLLVQGLCLHCPDLIESFVNVANHLMSRNQSSHSFREAQVTAAEIFAGIGGSSKYWSTHLQNRYFVSLSQLLANAIEKCPSDSVKDWSSAVRFVCTDMDPKRVHWLVSIVFNEAFGDNSVLSSSAPSQTFKRLLFLQAIMVEVAWRSPSLYDSVATKISANPNLLYSPFSQIRQEVSRLLCFVLRNSYRPGFEGNAISSIETILAAFEQILSPLIIQDWQTDNSTSISALETVIYWVVFCCTIGESTFSSDVIVRLISIVIHACHHPNAETAALAKHCLLSVAWTNFDNCYLQRLMDGCNNIIQSEALSFHSHLSAITFFSTLAIRHLFLLDVPKVKLALAAYEKLLGSSRIECREGSSRLLTGFISCAQSLISLKRFSKRFMQEAKSPTNAVSKHGAILALTALIKSEPYRVPEWMPEILAFCASFINDPAPIGGTIQKLFIEFKRTHQDTWHVDQEKFTEDQLTAVNEAIIAPSYFA